MGYHWDNKMPHLRFSAHLTPNESEAYKAGYAAGVKAGQQKERRYLRRVFSTKGVIPNWNRDELLRILDEKNVSKRLASRKRKEAK